MDNTNPGGNFSCEADGDTLMRAHEIVSDPERHKAAMDHLKTKAGAHEEAMDHFEAFHKHIHKKLAKALGKDEDGE